MMRDQGQQDWPDLAGRIEGTSHILPIRVYFEDTDFSGLVYHASYIRWCERGRSDFVRLLGLNQRSLFEGQRDDESAFFVVRHMELDYLKPALMDDVLEVVTKTEELGKASVDIAQEVRRHDQILFKAVVKIVLIGGHGRPMRISEAVRQAFVGEKSVAGHS